MSTVTYENPAQVEVVKAELAKLSKHDKALFAAESLQTVIDNIKATGWKAWVVKVAGVIIPLGIGVLIATYAPQLSGILSQFAG